MPWLFAYMALLDDLGSVLQTAGVGTVGADIFKGGLASTPDMQISMIESGGFSPLRELDNGVPVDRCTVQVSVRAAAYDYAAAQAQAHLAYAALDAVVEQVLSGRRYHQIEPLQPPFLLERDESDRPVFVFNILVEVDRT